MHSHGDTPNEKGTLTGQIFVLMTSLVRAMCLNHFPPIRALNHDNLQLALPLAGVLIILPATNASVSCAKVLRPARQLGCRRAQISAGWRHHNLANSLLDGQAADDRRLHPHQGTNSTTTMVAPAADLDYRIFERIYDPLAHIPTHQAGKTSQARAHAHDSRCSALRDNKEAVPRLAKKYKPGLPHAKQFIKKKAPLERLFCQLGFVTSTDSPRRPPQSPTVPRDVSQIAGRPQRLDIFSPPKRPAVCRLKSLGDLFHPAILVESTGQIALTLICKCHSLAARGRLNSRRFLVFIGHSGSPDWTIAP